MNIKNIQEKIRFNVPIIYFKLPLFLNIIATQGIGIGGIESN